MHQSAVHRPSPSTQHVQSKRDPSPSWGGISAPSPITAHIPPVDATIARRCARFHIPDPRPERDALIAATALVHGMILVTRNVADFEPTGAKIFNPLR